MPWAIASLIEAEHMPHVLPKFKKKLSQTYLGIGFLKKLKKILLICSK